MEGPPPVAEQSASAWDKFLSEQSLRVSAEMEEAGGDVSGLFKADGAVEVTLPSGKKVSVLCVRLCVCARVACVCARAVCMWCDSMYVCSVYVVCF